jgi:hypothetical protein
MESVRRNRRGGRGAAMLRPYHYNWRLEKEVRGQVTAHSKTIRPEKKAQAVGRRSRGFLTEGGGSSVAILRIMASTSRLSPSESVLL